MKEFIFDRRFWLSCLCFLCAGLLSVTQLQAQEEEAPEPRSETNGGPGKSKSKFKAYKDVITEKAISDTGLFDVHKVEENYYFEIPDSLLNREILVVSRMSGTIPNFTFGGAGMKTRPQQVVRWQRHDNQLLLRSVSYTNVADPSLPIYQSVRNNNYEPIIMAFDIKAFGKDSSTYVIDVKNLFTTDVEMIGPLSSNQRRNFGIKSLDKSRSIISYMKSFPQNVEVRHVLTYKADKLPANSTTGTLSLEMNQSFIILPEQPMKPRRHDQRVGYFSISQYDYGLDEQKAAQRTYITRWRLEPKDTAAFRRGELVEPIKPIVYYVDPATPEKWRPYIKKGVEDWQAAFEAAGFKNAILAKDPPSREEDPDWSPEDVRYSVIRYITTPIQNAQGPHVHDPRSGEILESDILWYHNVMNLLRNWYFVQTAAINPEARGVKFKDEVMGELIRFVAAHEVGHTLGLPHNMGASYAYPVDSLRSPSFTRRMGTAPSIMDFARFNYVAQPEDGEVALMPQIGIYDKYAIEWGYRPILDARTADEEKATLHSWIKAHEGDPLYRYGRQRGNNYDPSSQTEDLGNDAVKASSLGIANLRRIVPNLIEWTGEEGKDFEDLEELYGQVIGQFNRYMGHVRTNVGGIYEWYKTYDQDGTVYDPVPAARQREAVAFLNRELFQTPLWLVDNDILRQIQPAGILERIRSTQVNTLNQLLEPSRLGRLIETEALEGSQAYTLMQLFEDVHRGIWSELGSRQSIDVYRRNLQRAYLERMQYLLTNELPPIPPQFRAFSGRTPINVSQSDIRAVVRADLRQLEKELKAAAKRSPDAMTRAHLEDALARVERILEPED
ncbi:MAG: DUF5117 domain-containing protein [Bacteroidetes bacterium]|nr:MAG: DUF5117 domain-containing protein [Bacteroidota bacterium]